MITLHPKATLPPYWRRIDGTLTLVDAHEQPIGGMAYREQWRDGLRGRELGRELHKLGAWLTAKAQRQAVAP